MLPVPRGDLGLPLVPRQVVLVHHALGQQSVVGEEARLVVVLLEDM